MARLSAILLLSAFLLSTPALAHDPSAWGGLFRSRDFGGSWLPVDANLFIGGALAVAVSPADPNHLLYATDTRLLRSRNGGLDWSEEGGGRILGPVLAVAFDSASTAAVASSAGGVFFAREGGAWQDAGAPQGAVPARAIVALDDAGTFLLSGPGGLYLGTEGGARWRKLDAGLPDAPATLLVRTPGAPTRLFAIFQGAAWRGDARAASWRALAGGLPGSGVEYVTTDRRGRTLWAFASDRLFTSTDDGATWTPRGQPLFPPGTSVRGLAASDDGRTLVLATHRGLLRSVDSGATFAQVQGALPVHLESGLIAGDPRDAGTLYTGFALTPYPELWRRAEQGANLLARIDPVSLAGGAAFVTLLLGGGVWAARRLARAQAG